MANDNDDRLEKMDARLAANAAAIENLTRLAADLLQVVRLDHEAQKAIQIQAEQDRAAFQQETQRIWQYLLGQQRNKGNGGG